MIATGEVTDRAARKAGRRLLPFLLLLYIAAFLDRVNIAYVKTPILRDTGLSEAAFAFGAGIFFVTYALFEIPSNLILFRVGARLWIGRIMISWGIVAAALMFVRGASSFYALRAGLGIMEAGFFPGIILYLSMWFPARQRAPMLGIFYIGAPCAQILGGPISGWLLSEEGRMGLRGWQWVFLSEGLFAVGLGVATLLWLTNRPADAKWLTVEERSALQGALDEEERGRGQVARVVPSALWPERGQGTKASEASATQTFEPVGQGSGTAGYRHPSILANGRVWRLDPDRRDPELDWLPGCLEGRRKLFGLDYQQQWQLRLRLRQPFGFQYCAGIA